MLPWLLACSEPKVSLDESLPPPPPASDAIEIQYEPEWSIAELQQQFSLLLSYGVPNPNEILSHYQELYDEGATASCPGTEYNFDGSEASTYGCTTPDGFFFAGSAEFRYSDEYDWALHCDCRIVAPDGRMVRGAGNISFRMETRNGQSDMFADLRGSFLSSEGSEWLRNVPSTSFRINYFDNVYSVAGGYSINGLSVYFEELRFDACENGEGITHIRDPSGGWWTWKQPDDCSSSPVVFNDESRGDLTIDFSDYIGQIKDILESQ